VPMWRAWVMSEFQIKRHGVDPRFKGSVLRVPANVLRERLADVLSPADLAKRHRAYHYRVMIGPSYRACWVVRSIFNFVL